MFRMRTLMLLCLTLLGATAAHALGPELTFLASSATSKGSASIFAQGRDRAASEFSTNLGLGADVMNGKLRLKVEHAHMKRDYREVFLTARNGSQVPLAAQFDGAEDQVTSFAEVFGDRYQAGLNVSTSVGETPFPLINGGVSASYLLAEYGRRLFAEVANTSQKRPEDYFIHPQTLATTERPRLIEIRDYKAGIEQVFGESARLRWNLEVRQRPQDRPTAYGSSLHGAYSPRERWYIHLGTQYLRENRAENLLDERGYFELTSSEARLLYEPTYNITLSAGYGLAVERETARGRFADQTVGTDSYLVALSYSRRRIQADLSYRFQESNTKFSGNQFSGALKWEI